MSTFSSQALLEKLSRLTLSQESIETLSLWIIHHKVNAKAAIDIWLQELDKAGADKRLVLFYLANDILQNGRRRGAGEFLELFQDPLRQAVTMIGGQKIQTSIERMFRIWKERRLYDNAFLKELGLLIEPVRKPQVNESIPDFKLPLLEDAVSEFNKFEAELKVKSSQLSNLRVDVSNPSASLSMLKDKSAGGRVSLEFEEATQRLQDYCECLGIEVNERINILDMLKECKTFCAFRQTELGRTASDYKKLGLSVLSLKEKLDRRLKDLERAHSTAMSDPSAKEDITDVGDMEIESDGEGQDSHDKSATKHHPAPPSAPPPLPPPLPPPPSEDSSSMLSGPGMIVTPPISSYSSVQQFQPQGRGHMDDRGYSSMHQSSCMSAGASNTYNQPQQSYEQAYAGGMFVGHIYDQQHTPRVPMTTAVGRGGVGGTLRGRGIPVGPRYSFPRHVASLGGSVQVKGPPNPYQSRMLRPASHRAPLGSYATQPQATEDFSEDSEQVSALIGQNAAEDFSNDIQAIAGLVSTSSPVEVPQKADPFEVVKNMLAGIVKKKQLEMANNSEVSMNDNDPKEDVYTISAAPLLYGKPSPPTDSEKQDVDDDSLPYSPSSESIMIKQMEDCLPSPSSDTPSGEMTPGPNMDNPILQALYNSQVSPKEHHSPSALELLRAEDSDQEEEEFTSSELKNILEQVKSEDSPGSSAVTDKATEEAPYSIRQSSGGGASTDNINANVALAANISITPKLTNLLDQIFPQISQSLIERKRKQESGQDCNNTFIAVTNPPDAKVPRLAGPSARPMGPPQQPQLFMRSPGGMSTRLPGDMSARPPGDMSTRPHGGMSTRPPYPGVRYPPPRLRAHMSPSRMPPPHMTVESPRAPIYVGTDGAVLGGPAPPGSSNQPSVEYTYSTPSLGIGARGHPRGSRMRIMYQPGPRIYRMQRPPPPHGYRPMRPRFV